MAKLKILSNEAPVAWYGCQIALTLSASIGVYRSSKAEVFGGRSDGKSGVLREEVLYF
jgi:RecA/RadA recombinase